MIMDAVASVDFSERFPDLEKRDSIDLPAYNVPVARLLETMQVCRDELGFDMLMDVTAVDWHEESPRFTVIYHCFSSTRHRYLRLAVDCADDENPSVPTVCKIWPAADWHERETYDMFGIQFEGHPDLRRILMWEGYPYFPLRKEFPLAGIETELPAADVAEVTGAKVIAAPMMGGPFHASQEGAMSEREPRAADQSWSEENPKPDTGEEGYVHDD